MMFCCYENGHYISYKDKLMAVGSQLMNVFRKTDAEKTNSYCNNSYHVIKMVKYHRME